MLVKSNACCIPQLAFAMNFKVITYVVSEMDFESIEDMAPQCWKFNYVLEVFSSNII